MQRELAQEKQARQQAELRRRIEDDVRAIARMDPDVQKLEDVIGQPEYPKILEYVRHGNSLTDAYRLAHFEKLSGRQAEAAALRERNAAAGKEHLRATGNRGGSGVEVTPDELAEYRKFDPSATMDEVRAFKARDAKRKRG